ncbi:hypothetical protein ACVXG9_20895 [Escherichia coli]
MPFGSLDDDRANGCIRSLEHAYSKDGGLAVLYGNFTKTAASLKPRASMTASSNSPARRKSAKAGRRGRSDSRRQSCRGRCGGDPL